MHEGSQNILQRRLGGRHLSAHGVRGPVLLLLVLSLTLLRLFSFLTLISGYAIPCRLIRHCNPAHQRLRIRERSSPAFFVQALQGHQDYWNLKMLLDQQVTFLSDHSRSHNLRVHLVDDPDRAALNDDSHDNDFNA